MSWKEIHLFSGNHQTTKDLHFSQDVLVGSEKNLLKLA